MIIKQTLVAVWPCRLKIIHPNVTWGCPIAGVTLKGRRGPTTPALTVNVVSLRTPLRFGLPPTLPTKEDLPFKSTVNTVELSTVTPSGRTCVRAKSRSPVLSTLARTDRKPVWSGIIGIWINRNECGATVTSIFRNGKSCNKNKWIIYLTNLDQFECFSLTLTLIIRFKTIVLCFEAPLFIWCFVSQLCISKIENTPFSLGMVLKKLC